MEESEKLELIADALGYSEGVMGYAISYCHKIISRYLRPGSILELGPAEGVMTNLLVQDSGDLTVVEASMSFCERIKSRHPSVTVYRSLFEAFEPERRYDNIILGHVLEHVKDPVGLLVRAGRWLQPDGILFAAVPNAHSLHRQAAVGMGLLETEASLSPSDIEHGHRRVFAAESFRQAFVSAGLPIVKFGGYWLKPLANSQIEEGWTPSMIEAFMELGEKYPEIAGEIYIVAARD